MSELYEGLNEVDARVLAVLATDWQLYRSGIVRRTGCDEVRVEQSITRLLRKGLVNAQSGCYGLAPYRRETIVWLQGNHPDLLPRHMQR